MFPVVVIAIIVVPIAAAVAGVGAAVRHFEGEYSTMQAMREWARSRGFTFHPEWHSVVADLQSEVPGIGRAWAGFRGELPDGRKVFGANCTWETGGGQSRTSQRRDVRGVRIDGVEFPMLVVHRRWRSLVMHPVLWASQVLDVEHPWFSRRWAVACPSSRLAHDLLHPRVVEMLVEAPRWIDSVWFHGDTIFAAVRGSTPARTDEVLELLGRLANLVPKFTAEELGDGIAGAMYGESPRQLGRHGIVDSSMPWWGGAG